MFRKNVICATLLTLALSTPAHSALINRGNGMIYDTSSNLTWLQDANYASTTGYGRNEEDDIFDVDEQGRMDHDFASRWALNLVYGGYDDWRLPNIIDITDNGCANPGLDKYGYFYFWEGSDCGYNVSTERSELAHLWTNTLGNQAVYDTIGNARQAGGLTSTGRNGVNFINLQSGRYWLNSPYGGESGFYWYFDTSRGFQSWSDTGGHAWAVREGDVRQTNLNESSTSMLLLVAVTGFLFRRKHAKQLVKNKPKRVLNRRPYRHLNVAVATPLDGQALSVSIPSTSRFFPSFSHCSFAFLITIPLAPVTPPLAGEALADTWYLFSPTFRASVCQAQDDKKVQKSNV